ncbi:hypothetical protein TIFTF001_035421 [Ficus carica]|uniref:Uncharacterized protein n=1 Tax=Ficus carica TaxID=3494 RepID=A0AA88E263_FICCA|nr:hypothetical protein TIFTF001_035421 [Ficus carica]
MAGCGMEGGGANFSHPKVAYLLLDKLDARLWRDDIADCEIWVVDIVTQLSVSQSPAGPTLFSQSPTGPPLLRAREGLQSVGWSSSYTACECLQSVGRSISDTSSDASSRGFAYKSFPVSAALFPSWGQDLQSDKDAVNHKDCDGYRIGSHDIGDAITVTRKPQCKMGNSGKNV